MSLPSNIPHNLHHRELAFWAVGWGGGIQQVLVSRRRVRFVLGGVEFALVDLRPQLCRFYDLRTQLVQMNDKLVTRFACVLWIRGKGFSAITTGRQTRNRKWLTLPLACCNRGRHARNHPPPNTAKLTAATGDHQSPWGTWGECRRWVAHPPG